MLNITWKDKRPMTKIKESKKVGDLATIIRQLKWTWAGHIIRKATG